MPKGASWHSLETNEAENVTEEIETRFCAKINANVIQAHVGSLFFGQGLEIDGLVEGLCLFHKAVHRSSLDGLGVMPRLGQSHV